MNKLILGIAIAGFTVAGASAFAQDSNMQKDSSTTSTSSSMSKDSMMKKHHMMKDCMTEQKAKNDGSTKAQMKKMCSDQMKSMSKDSSMSK